MLSRLADIRSLLPTDQQIADWTAAARTPRTRARIRRWSRAEAIGLAILLAGLALSILGPFASIAVAVWSVVSDNRSGHLYWWIWGIALGVTALGAVAFATAMALRQRACFADGHVTVGTVDRAIEHPGSGDDLTWFDLRISAVLADGITLHRRLHLEGQDLGRRVGRPIRFRHNSLRTDALDDVHLAGWPAGDGKRS
ncbi:hypothetical protein [Gordonia hydrophobica]|uniref:Uncharacterized protein n=1 Tax=Gordonia hydrophobica TaxID=40516 RepID=A0ABZ2U5Y6_9ACTN|nr:hypothetical protein [Gordonia hydrophobica]MBM7368662.1 hypothetical protein [Gordonia hydrophobica]